MGILEEFAREAYQSTPQDKIVGLVNGLVAKIGELQKELSYLEKQVDILTDKVYFLEGRGE